MDNFYLDNPELRFHLTHPLMKKIVALKERNYIDKAHYDYAPVDFEDAMDSYDKVLEIVGDICANIISPNAESVDQEGPELGEKGVTYARGTKENLDAIVKAGLMGITLPREYEGLNFPMVPYTMIADIVSRADASFVNIWGLQDCAETIHEFATEEQKKRFLPRVSKGATMAMDLTEPDAGSDLQAVMLKATFNEDGSKMVPERRKAVYHQWRRRNIPCSGPDRRRFNRCTRIIDVHFRQDKPGCDCKTYRA